MVKKTINNAEYEVDKSGYLIHLNDWNEALAIALAQEQEIQLSDAHWEVIHFVRSFYIEYNTSPAMRMLVKAMGKKLGPDKGNSRYLYTLFPKGAAKQATLIAGLPKPTKCI